MEAVDRMRSLAQADFDDLAGKTKLSSTFDAFLEANRAHYEALAGIERKPTLKFSADTKSEAGEAFKALRSRGFLKADDEFLFEGFYQEDSARA